MSGRPLAALKNGASIQVVNRSAMVAPTDNQFADLSMSEPACLFHASLTCGALETLWMKMLSDPLRAGFMVEKFGDWKFHAGSLPLPCTSFTHEPTSLLKLNPQGS